METAQAKAATPTRFVVGRVADIPEGSRIVIDVLGRSVGVFNVEGSFYALLNRCPHQGAELCKGSVLGLVDSARPGDVRIDTSRKFIVCPWHGWEYDLATGESWFNPGRTRARRYPVAVQGGAEVEDELAGGTAQTLADGTLIDAATHRTKGPYTAEVLPIAVEDDYLVISLR